MTRILIFLLLVTQTMVAQLVQWERVGLAGTKINFLDADHGGNLFASTQSSGLYRSTDNGQSWIRLTNNIQDSTFGTIWITPTNVVIANSSRRYYFSTDQGNSWMVRDTLPGSIVGFAGNAVYVHPLMKGPSGQPNALYKSTDCGASWLTLGVLNTSKLAVNSHGVAGSSAQSCVYVNSGYWNCTYWGLISYDGLTWTTYTAADYPYYPVIRSNRYDRFFSNGGDVVRHYDHNINYYFTEYVSDVRLYLTNSLDQPIVLRAAPYAGVGYRNGTASNSPWTMVNPNRNTSDLSVSALAISPNDFLFVGTVDSGIYRSTSPYRWLGPTFVAEPTRVPQFFDLNHNYPNPFNSTTTIRFALPTDGHLTARVLDIRGVVVATLFSGHAQVGEHILTWKADNFSSGLYFCELTFGNQAKAIPMTLMK